MSPRDETFIRAQVERGQSIAATDARRMLATIDALRGVPAPPAPEAHADDCTLRLVGYCKCGLVERQIAQDLEP